MVRLGDICKFQSGGTPSKSESEYYNGDIPWITTVALNGSTICEKDAIDWITETAIAKSAAKIVPVNSIMVGTRVGVGKVAINSVPMSTSQDIISLIDIDESQWNKAYICKYIIGKSGYLNSQARGATIKGIKIDTLAELQLPEISVVEQSKIAAVIDKLDGIIGLRKEQLVKLDELVKARFVEMFDVFGEYAKLSDIALVTGGLTKNSKREQLPLKLPYLRVANVSFAHIDVTEMLEIGLTEEEREKTLLNHGDLLFVEGNGSPDQIGRVALWRDDVVPCVHQNHLIKARFNTASILPVFAMYYFMTPKGRMQIKSKAVSTSGLYTLSVSKISDLLLPCPPVDLQQEFVAFVEQTNKTKLTIQASLDKLEVMKKALMQEYFG